MEESIGGMWFICCIEIVLISESPLLEVSLYTNNVIHCRTWFESGNDLCWEEVIQSLKEIGMPALANQLALKYHLTKG